MPQNAPAGQLLDLTDCDLDENDDFFPDDSIFDADDEPGNSDDSVVDYGDEYSQVPETVGVPPKEPSAWVGRKVRHASFGAGRVVAAGEVRQGIKLVVKFGAVGTKTVMANYVELASS